MDVLERGDLPFPRSLPEFQRVFPDDVSCAAWLEKARWSDGFACPGCGIADGPHRFAARPGALRCRSCRRDASLTAGTVMHRSHTPLATRFRAAWPVAGQTQGMSAARFRRQPGLSRHGTAFHILHRLRAGMVRPDRDRTGRAGVHVEVGGTWIGGRARGEGRGVHHRTPVAAAAGDRSVASLRGFIESAVVPGATAVTDNRTGHAGLAGRGYGHCAVAGRGDPEVAGEFLPVVHPVSSSLETWPGGIHHGVSPKHLQAHLNGFVFRFSRRHYPFNAFRSLPGTAGGAEAPTYAGLHKGQWRHPSI